MRLSESINSNTDTNKLTNIKNFNAPRPAPKKRLSHPNEITSKARVKISANSVNSKEHQSK